MLPCYLYASVHFIKQIIYTSFNVSDPVPKASSNVNFDYCKRFIELLETAVPVALPRLASAVSVVIGSASVQAGACL